MIISRTPLRFSFVGGGSDLPVFYREYGGAVVSTSIDKYIYVTVNKKFDDGIRLAYSITEEVDSPEDINHKIVREVLCSMGGLRGLEITTIADIPSRGTGLGSSSSFTVGLLHALNAYAGKYVSSEFLASESCKVEIEMCKEPIGKQDQYAAAFGGFNIIEFQANDSVVVSPIICKAETTSRIASNIMVFYTGVTRSASALLAQQSDSLTSDASKQKAMQKMVSLAYDLKDELQKNNVDTFGEILHENWLLKKSQANGISTEAIDSWYAKAVKEGALGGKILGAGAGGFLLLYVPEERQEAVREALSELRVMDFKFDSLGSRIIFYH